MAGSRPQLPIIPGEASNGEFIPRLPTARDRWIATETLARVAEAADRLRMDRRLLLQSASGLAAMLGIVNLAACSSKNEGRSAPPTAAPSTSSTSTTTSTAPATTTTGGTFEVPEPTAVAECEQVLGSQGEFIVDVHTHHVVPDGPWRQNATRIADMISRLVPDGCLEADPYVCLDRASYLHDLFIASDTTVAMLSDVPSSGPDDSPVPFADQVDTQSFADALTVGGAPRVLVQAIVAPNFGDLAARIDDMTAKVETRSVASLKFYTAWGPERQGYALNDPAIGLPVIEQARADGVKVVAAHKGLPLLEFDRRFNGPEDVVAVAALYPDLQFVIYHSAFEREVYEGPYDPANAARGVNSLVKAMDDHGLPPNSNVWAELGTTWRETLDDPTQAAHVLGKLLTRMGEDRVLWGTDAIWLGSPQPQIMAFRAFQITTEFQELFGYPELTDTIKRKVLGLNAAQLLDLDAEATRCALAQDPTANRTVAYRDLVPAQVVPEPWRARGPVTRREVLTWLRGSPDTRPI